MASVDLDKPVMANLLHDVTRRMRCIVESFELHMSVNAISSYR